MHNTVNQEIERLWQDDYPQWDEPKLRPLAVKEIAPGSILFVGLNPSFSEKGWKRVAGAGFNPNDFYKWGSEKYNSAEDSRHEEHAKEVHPYFARFRDIKEKFNKPWGHIDLFFVRCTSQKELKAKLKSSPDFFGKQLAQSKQLIIASAPLLIVVANAEASDRYRELFAKDLKDSKFEEKGYHYTKLDGRHIPTFFTSMLTGQRALDNGSFERLCWQIGQALKNEQGLGGQS